MLASWGEGVEALLPTRSRDRCAQAASGNNAQSSARKGGAWITAPVRSMRECGVSSNVMKYDF